MAFWVYILRCADNSYYTGHTDNLEQRIAQHHQGYFPTCYTYKRRPLELVFSQDFATREEALASEQQIKGWSRKKKEAMMHGDWAEVSRLAKSPTTVRPELVGSSVHGEPVEPQHPSTSSGRTDGGGYCMKAGWEVKTLGEVCEIVNGGTPKTGVEEYWGGEHLWITPAEMGKRLSPYADDTARKITSQGLRDSSARLLPPNSVILSSRAPIGHLVINTKPMATNQGCKGLIPSENLAYKYLFYFLQANVDLLNDLGSGATFKELSGGKLKEVKIPLATIAEQQRIVAILDQAFEGIAKARTNAQQNLQNARALFESHLQSVFSVRGELATSPVRPELVEGWHGSTSSPRTGEGWVEKRLKEVCEKITDGTHQTPTYFESGVVFLSSRNVTSGTINWENIKYIDTQQHIQMHKRVAPRLNDILLAKNGTTGVAAIVDKDVVFDIYVSLALLRPLNMLLPNLLLYFINSPVAKVQFNKRLKGTGVPNLHLEEIREVVISFPKELDEQENLIKQLDILSNQVKRLEALYQRKIACLDELKKSLLQQAFAGEL